MRGRAPGDQHPKYPPVPPYAAGCCHQGRSPAKTLSMWDRVLDGETRYIKGFKSSADFLLDTSFTYELGIIVRSCCRSSGGSLRWKDTMQSCGTTPPGGLSMCSPCP